MSGWIKLEKDLATDPRVLRMSSRLRHADVTLASCSRIVIVGALVTLWWYADTHIGDDDVLPIGADQINELVGIDGFCDLMPSEWLQVLDANSVKLINYTAHNGTTSKKRALDQRRQERHRNSNADVTLASRSSVTRPRPREDLYQEKTKSTSAAAPPTRPGGGNPVSRGTDPDWWLDFKLAYPERSGDQKWRAAISAAKQRIAEGHTPEQILAGARRYAAYIQTTGKTGTEYVKQASSFLGKGDPPPFMLPWHPPPTAENATDRILRTLNQSDDRVIEHEPDRSPRALSRQ